MSYFPSTTTLDGAAPAFAALVTVPTSGARQVYGTINCASGAGTAGAALEVETGVGTGAYARVQTVDAPTGSTINHAYSVLVLAGRRYRFVDLSGGAGVTTITDYSFVDNP